MNRPKFGRPNRAHRLTFDSERLVVIVLARSLVRYVLLEEPGVLLIRRTIALCLCGLAQNVSAATRAPAADNSSATSIEMRHVMTRAGPLRIQPRPERDRSSELMVTLAGRPVPVLTHEAEYSFEWADRLPKTDVVLVNVGGRGTACPSRWVFLTVDPAGVVTSSRMFGNCSRALTVDRGGDTIHVHLAAIGGGASLDVDYAGGAVNCTSCGPRITKGGVTISGRKLEIRHAGGRDAVFLSGKPVGLEANALYRFGPVHRAKNAAVQVFQTDPGIPGCPAKFAFLTIDAAGRARVSDLFGNCSDAPDIVNAGGGLLFARFDLGPDGGVVVGEGYVFSDGKVSKH